MLDLKMDHVHIHSSDVKKTIAYYKRMFDGTLTLNTMIGDLHLIRMKIGDGYVNIFERPPGTPDPKPENSPIHHFAFRVRNFEAAIDELRKKGAEFAVGPKSIGGKTKLVYVRAPDNVLIEVLETSAY